MRRLALLAAAAAALALAGCGGDDSDTQGDAAFNAEVNASTLAFADGDVRSGEEMDSRYTCDGDDISPELRWGGVPEETAELALILEDPDADGFTHWLVYSMRPNAARLPPLVQPVPQVAGPTPLLLGENDFGDVGYGGPCPPDGETHTYVFRLLALDTELGLEPGTDREAFDEAVQGHVIAEAGLETQYRRS